MRNKTREGMERGEAVRKKEKKKKKIEKRPNRENEKKKRSEAEGKPIFDKVHRTI